MSYIYETNYVVKQRAEQPGSRAGSLLSKCHHMKFASLLILLYWIQDHTTLASVFLTDGQVSGSGIEELQHQPVRA